MDSLENDLKSLIIEVFSLDELKPDDIDTHAPLFGEGLGLDSIDALELGLALKNRFDIIITAETPEVRTIFSSIAHLADYIRRIQSS